MYMLVQFLLHTFVKTIFFPPSDFQNLMQVLSLYITQVFASSVFLPEVTSVSVNVCW